MNITMPLQTSPVLQSHHPTARDICTLQCSITRWRHNSLLKAQDQDQEQQDKEVNSMLVGPTELSATNTHATCGSLARQGLALR